MPLNDKQELLKLIQEKQNRQNEKIRTWVPSIIQEACMASDAQIRVVVGGNRAGKSEVGSMAVSIGATQLVPDSVKKDFPKSRLAGGAYWCSALDFGGARDIIKQKLDETIPARLLAGFSKADKIYYLTNKAEIGLKSEESKEDKYAGVSRHGVWMDEEHSKAVYDEIFERVQDCNGFIIFTFTALKGLTWSHNELYKKAAKIYFTKNVHNIPEETGLVHTVEEIDKMKERKLFMKEGIGEQVDPNIEIFIITKYDNSYLSSESIQKSERKYKDDIPNYNARILGEYTRVDDSCVFSIKRLIKMAKEAPSTYTIGDVSKAGQFKQHPRGSLVIFDDLKVIRARTYVIGADVAEGTEHGDFNCAQVLNARTGNQAAIWHGKCSPEDFAWVLVQLGRLFNNAWIAPERNFHGFGVVNRIKDHFKYKRLYSEYDIPKHAILKGAKPTQKKYGWDTNVKTKAIMIQDLSAFISEGHIKLYDPNTIDELLTFIYHKNGKTGARGGCFDDRVMALAIAVQVFKHRGSRRIIRSKDNSIKPTVSDVTGY